MKLINEIIAEALDNDKPIAGLLRKCLVLAFDLKNEKLKAWVEQELNGYVKRDEVPAYRTVHLTSKGNFSGPMGAWIPKRPLPMGVLEKKHRDVLVPTHFAEPIAAYEIGHKDGKGEFIIGWSPDLIAMYQEKFIEGYALSQAWQEVPEGLFRSIMDTVRTRLLRFALEIREELGVVGDEPEKIPTAKVDAAVTTFIFGGNNVINSKVDQLSQQGDTTVIAGDFTSLARALKALGVADGDIADLKEATEQDAADNQSGVGQKTKGWLTKLAAKMGGAGWTIGTAAGVELVKEMIEKYLS